MKQKLYQFMYGRNGLDQLSRFISYLALVFIVLDLIFRNTFLGGVLWYLAVVLLIYAYFRMFSKKLEKRRAENAKYLQAKANLINGFKDWRDRSKQRKDFVFFRCPSCKAMLRVPRGKGKIRVTCRKCGAAFERKT